ncbi:ATP-binding protein [Streptomyces sp. 796.1]|uniref:ATP-binding protein n=1 Tax=Streptomyces sp. 796.1 TaxID=3163029 RepID=UPI0039C9CD81
MTTTTTRPRATGFPGYSETWPCEAQSAARARSLVRAVLQTWNLACLIDRGVLAISELVGNSVQHTNCELVQFSITMPDRHCVRISVTDTSEKLPRLRFRSSGEDMSGRGLTLVAFTADQWGVDVHPKGKTVWVEMLARQTPSNSKAI